MNPITAYVLNVREGTAFSTGTRSYLYLDEAAATAMGEKMKAAKPIEATVFEYEVVMLEGAPA